MIHCKMTVSKYGAVHFVCRIEHWIYQKTESSLEVRESRELKYTSSYFNIHIEMN